MKNRVFFLMCFCVANVVSAQYTFTKQWDRTLGGTKDEYWPSFKSTLDGGCIVGGSSTSGISGDKTQACWGVEDFWVVKLDLAGNKEWDKRFGPTQGAAMTALQICKDKSYILGGYAGGPATGDKTEASRGSYDYWVVKVDDAGNKEWDKRFGGTGEDLLWTLDTCKDGGFILGGTSASGIGGDKTEDCRGGAGFYFDYWVVKIDSDGNKEWDKRFGGNKDDFLWSVKQTKDGGYILGGWSNSDSSWDKTQPSWGGRDYWIVKIDSLGNKEWDKRFGSELLDELHVVLSTRDDGYLLGGGSADSTITGDKTCFKRGAWLIKLDGTGTIIWQVVYDGGGMSSLIKTNDDGYMYSGESTRSDFLVYPSVDRTDDCLGESNSWVIKLDSLGHKQWDKTIFTTGSDKGGYSVQTSDGCYAVANTSSAGIDGYKTQAAWDSSYDYFVVKFCIGDEVGVDDRPQTIDHSGIQMQAWPNPFCSDLSIVLKVDDIHEASFAITNAMGQLIYKREESNLAAGYTKVLDLSYLPNGVYFVEVGTKEGCSVRQVVKE